MRLEKKTTLMVLGFQLNTEGNLKPRVLSIGSSNSTFPLFSLLALDVTQTIKPVHEATASEAKHQREYRGLVMAKSPQVNAVLKSCWPSMSQYTALIKYLWGLRPAVKTI